MELPAPALWHDFADGARVARRSPGAAKTTRARDAGWLSADEAETLSAAYGLFWSLHAATRLIGMGPGETGSPGEAAAQFLCRSGGGTDDMDTLRDRLEARYEECAAIIEAALQRGGAGDGTGA